MQQLTYHKCDGEEDETGLDWAIYLICNLLYIRAELVEV